MLELFGELQAEGVEAGGDRGTGAMVDEVLAIVQWNQGFSCETSCNCG